MKAVSLCLPLTGGIYRMFVDLRRGLGSLGIELSWLASGRSALGLLGPSASAEDLSMGTVVAPETDDELPRAARLLDCIHREKVDLVIFNVLGGPIDTNLARHLPQDVLRILIVHSITPATYRAAHAIRDHVHATIGVSPRIASDLVTRYGFDPDWTIVIPNAVDVAAFTRCHREPSSGGFLRVLSLGRVEDISKGVHWIPSIFRKAVRYGADLRLTIAGDGPDLPALRHRFVRVPSRDAVSFPGSIPPGKVAALMTSHDVFLMPSRFEGFSITLAEAVAAGCVPVASHIRGATDYIVEHGRTGFLFPVGDTTAAARFLARLARDRALLAALSAEARRSAAERFTLENQAAAYRGLIERCRTAPRPVAPALPLDCWRIPPGLRPAWWRRLPEPMKNLLRLATERARLRATAS